MNLKKKSLSFVLAFALVFSAVSGLTSTKVYAAATHYHVTSFATIPVVNNLPGLSVTEYNSPYTIENYLNYYTSTYSTVTAYTDTSSVQIPVKWSYNASFSNLTTGQYVFDGSIDYNAALNYTYSIDNWISYPRLTVNLAYNSIMYDTISPIYVNSANQSYFVSTSAVISYLNSNYRYIPATIGNQRYDLPVTTWAVVGNYNPSVVGSYTFSATVDSGYIDYYNSYYQKPTITIVLTTAIADKTAPSVPTFTATVTKDSNVSLSITEPFDNVGVKGYVVYVDGKIAADITTKTYTITNLTAGIHQITVLAYDAAGNRSAQSSAKSVTVTGKLVKSSDGTYYTSEETKLKKEVLTTIYDLKTTLVVKNSDYQWVIDGRTIDTKNLTSQYDLTLNDLTAAKQSSMKTAITKAKNKSKENNFENIRQFEISQKNGFPFETSLQLSVGSGYRNDHVYVYLLNQTKRTLELVAGGEVDSNGFVTIENPGNGVYLLGTHLLQSPTLSATRIIYMGFDENVPLLNVLPDASVTYRSSDPSIVTVNSKGVMTGNHLGSATLTATVSQAGNRYTLTTKVTVKESAFEFIRSTKELEVGNTFAFRMRTLGYSKDVVWETSDESIATIDKSGVLTGVSRGTVTVYATSSGKTLSIQVQVR